MKLKKILNKKTTSYLIISIFTVLYSILGLLKHRNFLSGYDLAIIDQAIWKYSQLKEPIMTVHAFYGTSILADHIEFIYVLVSPLYWIFGSAYLLIILQVISVTLSGLAIFKLSRLKKIKYLVSISILISYLTFYGFQNALWADVHSLVFAVGFLAWFIYFLEKKNLKFSFIFFILAILCKEDIALLTLMISGVYFIINKDRFSLLYVSLSIFYLIYIFFIHYPILTADGYRYQNPNGILSDINPYYMIDTSEKQQVILYSLGWFGFIPLLTPFALIPAIGDLAHYFVLGQALVTSAQGFFLHYRSSLAVLLVWPLIISIGKYPKLNTKYIAIYILLCAAFFQYYLHLPLSYLSKSWFWEKPQAVNDINTLIEKIPKNASVVSQNNITPHIAHRDNIYTLWPETKEFKTNSPCNDPNCNWFRWGGYPEYLIVDTSPIWDARHFLTNREEFIKGLTNMETTKRISVYFRLNNTTIYKINYNF